MLRPTQLLIFLAILGAPAGMADEEKSRPRVRIGGISAGYMHTSGNGWYGPWGPYGYSPFYRNWWGLYDPFWSSPFVHPGLYRGFGYGGPDMGQIKLQAPPDASVYLDGAYAGAAQKLKTIWLEPGIYDLKVTAGSNQEYSKKVYVLSGKRLDIKTELEAKP